MLGPNDHPDGRQAYPKNLFLDPQIFSVASKVMLKCWAVHDRQVSGMQLLEKNMPDACSPHIYLFLQLNMHLAVSYLFRYCNILPGGCTLTSSQARSHFLMWEGMEDAAYV